jgi:hypothetical protein
MNKFLFQMGGQQNEEIKIFFLVGGQRGEGALTKTKHSLHKKPQN